MSITKKNELHKKAVDSLDGRVASMRRALSISECWKREDDDEVLSFNDVLSIRERQCLDIELGTGGPADWVRVYLEEGCISDVEYHYAEMFEHEAVHLPPNEYDVIVAWARDVLMVGASHVRNYLIGTKRRS